MATAVVGMISRRRRHSLLEQRAQRRAERTFRRARARWSEFVMQLAEGSLDRHPLARVNATRDRLVQEYRRALCEVLRYNGAGDLQ